MSAFKERAQQECTKKPIFLFQKRVWVAICEPEGYYTDPDGDCFTNDNGDVLTFKTCLEKGVEGEFYDLCVVREEWITELVFLTREEGEAYAKSREYNYSQGWRVYCVPCEGKLAEVIKAADEVTA
ncbi:MAG: hypothetical protein AAFX78_03360 [Cyanobacteria bacterium J06638_20]